MAPQKRVRNANRAVTRKGRKIRKPYKTARGHRRSTAGKIFPPLHVRSKNQLHNVMKYIKQGPITVLVVVADWCGHCQNLKPHIEAAGKLPQRNVQLMTVRDDMLSGYNNAVNHFNRSASPIEADGYPSIMLVGQDGKKLSEIAPTKEALKSAMVNVAPVAVEAGIASSNSMVLSKPRNMAQPRNNSPEEIVENVVENEIVYPNQDSLSAPASFEHLNLSNDTIINEGEESDDEFSEEESMSEGDIGVSPVVQSLTFSANANASRPSPNRIVTQPVPNTAVKNKKIHGAEGEITKSEAEGITSLRAEPVSPGTGNDSRMPVQKAQKGGNRGGSLYGIMTQSAYRLAPAAVLLATAAAVMKKNTHKRRNIKRVSRTKKRSTKRRH